MFECLVCGAITVQLSYGIKYETDFIPLCSRRCRRLFVNDPVQFTPSLVELGEHAPLRGRDPR
jgi:hypothetical protein